MLDFFLKMKKIHSGLMLDLKSHTVVVGERIISDSLEFGVNLLKSSSPKVHSQKLLPEKSQVNLALDFSSGVSFEAACKSKFGHPVTLDNYSHRRAFLLVASFGRACFKLDIHTVAIALQSCFGGSASLYKVRLLSDRTFRFSVASTAVGFEIYNKSKICTPMFDFFLNLWGNGGPNWLIEEKKFYKETDSEWQVVQRKKSATFGNKRVSVFQRMQTPLAPASSPISNSSLHLVSPNNQANHIQTFPSQRASSNAHLPGLLPFFKFPSFNHINWPDDSFLTWFKAHGPAPEVQVVSSFREFSAFLYGKKSLPSFVASASSHSPPSSSPKPPPPLPAIAVQSEDPSPTMANIPIDPRPFVPQGYQIQNIAGRLGVKRVVVPRRPKEHEQYAIATITPFPEGLVPFQNVRDVLEEYFTEVARVGFVSLHSCPFGAAYVQFRNVSDRDRLIASSPNQFGDVHISFVKHDEGVNWRGVTFNRDVWLLLVGPPLDHI
jgi:hypothetical protein